MRILAHPDILCHNLTYHPPGPGRAAEATPSPGVMCTKSGDDVMVGENQRLCLSQCLDVSCVMQADRSGLEPASRTVQASGLCALRLRARVVLRGAALGRTLARPHPSRSGCGPVPPHHPTRSEERCDARILSLPIARRGLSARPAHEPLRAGEQSGRAA